MESTHPGVLRHHAILTDIHAMDEAEEVGNSTLGTLAQAHAPCGLRIMECESGNLRTELLTF